MDKKGILGIALAIVGLVAWQIYYNKQVRAWHEYQQTVAAEEARKAEAKAKEAAAQPGATGTPNVEATATAAAPAAAPATPEAPEKVETIDTGVVEYTFTNRGGGISRAVLAKHEIDTKTKAPVILNEFGSIPIGALSFEAGKDTNKAFNVTRDDPNGKITFERVDERQLAITKTFTLPKRGYENPTDRLRDEYRFAYDLTFTNRSEQPIQVPTYWVYTGSTVPLHETDPSMFIGLNYFRGSSNKVINLDWFREGGFLFFGHGARPVFPETPESMDDIRWAAVANQYFTTLISPVVDDKLMSDQQKTLRGIGVWARYFDIPAESWTKAGRVRITTKPLGGLDGAVAMAGFTLEPGKSATRQFEAIAGPSEYGRLRLLNDYETEILDFGMFGWISKGLLWSLNTLRSWLGSYWAAIMVLTIIIRSAMWPLQNRATQTAKKMQALSPRLKELQDKYKEDPMRLQQETTKLWREYGINPIGGCLPLLVQIPIFFGFYNMLNRAVELRNNGFLWVQDLSQPDTIARFAGIPINILPLVMAVTMFAQMKLTPKAGDPVQQRIMMFMPLIFIALCYNYAAALALYWSVQNLFSIVQLYVTRDKNPVTVQRVEPPSARKAKR
jgi:YidC/Oxa1 family membrane protein insertase